MDNNYPNYDVEAGVHYGVIHSNKLNQYALEGIYEKGTDLNYEDALENAKEKARGAIAQALDCCKYEEGIAAIQEALQSNLQDYCSDHLIDQVIDAVVADYPSEDDIDEATVNMLAETAESVIDDDFGSDYQGEGGSYLFEDEEYKLQLCEDGDVFVIKSSWVTIAARCSPCAPGAGYLNGKRGSNSMGDEILTYCLGPEWFDTVEDEPNEDYARRMPYECRKLEEVLAEREKANETK